MTDHNKKLTARQTASLQRLGQAREDLLTAIQGLDQVIICSERVVGDWTIKDLLGHITSWNQEFRENIDRILEGKHPGYDHQISEEVDFSAVNKLWSDLKQDWSLERILVEAEEDYDQASALILKLTLKELRMRGVTSWKDAAIAKPKELTTLDTDSVGTLINFHWRHMNMHICQIKKWHELRKL